MFKQEEKLVNQAFLAEFQTKAIFLERLLKQNHTLLHTIKSKPDDYAKYTGLILATVAVKSSYSGYDRLSRGYLGDAETILKRVIEAIIYGFYLSHHSAAAKRWCEGEPPGNLVNRKQACRELDAKRIFPSDMDNFFEGYIYPVFYANSNKVAHLDFEYVHYEMGVQENPDTYATTIVTGPAYHQDYMRVLLNRFTLFSMFILNFLYILNEQSLDESFEEVFKEFINTFPVPEEILKADLRT